MSIVKRARSEDDFIAAVKETDMPDTEASARRRVQISLTIPRATLEELDTLAKKLRQPRASLINLMIRQGLDKGLTFDGLNDD